MVDNKTIMKHQHVIEVRDSKAHAYSQVGEFDKLLFNDNPMFFYIYKNNTITDGEQISIVASRRGFRIKEKLPEISSELEALEASCQHACFVQYFLLCWSCNASYTASALLMPFSIEN